MLKKYVLLSVFAGALAATPQATELPSYETAPAQSAAPAAPFESPFKIIENPTAPNLIQKGLLLFELVTQKQHATPANLLKRFVPELIASKLFNHWYQLGFGSNKLYFKLAPLITNISQRALIDQNGIKHALKKGSTDFLRLIGFHSKIFNNTDIIALNSSNPDAKLRAQISEQRKAFTLKLLNTIYLYRTASQLMTDFEKECNDKKVNPEIVHSFFPPNDNYLSIKSLNSLKMSFIIRFIFLINTSFLIQFEEALTKTFTGFQETCKTLMKPDKTLKASREIDKALKKLCLDDQGKLNQKALQYVCTNIPALLADLYFTKSTIHIPYTTLHQLSPELQERLHDFMWIG